MKTSTPTETLMNILVVSGNPKDASSFKNMMHSIGSGCSFSHCTKLQDAVDLISKNKNTDVILLDLQLTDSSGLQTLQTLKSQNKEIPVIVLAHSMDKEMISSLIKAGAEDYLLKDNLNVDNVNYALKCAVEWKKIKVIKDKIHHQSTILSKATEEIIRSNNAQLIFKSVCQNISELNKNLKAIAFITETTDQKIARVTCTSGLESYLAVVSQLSGFNIFKTVFPVQKYSDNLLNLFLDTRIHELEGGLYEISAGKYNKHIAKFIEKILEINLIYGIGFSRDEVIYGGLIILTNKNLDPEEKSIIEAISSQASLNLQYKKKEEELKDSERRYKSFFIDSPVPKWEKDYSEIKKEIELLKTKGIKNLVHYFEKNPGKLDEWIYKVKITDVNPAVVEFFNANSVEELMQNPPSPTKEIRDSYLREFMYLFHGKTKFDVERQLTTLDGKLKRLYLRWAVAEGFEDTLQRVIVSGFDTTEIKRSEESLMRLNEGLELQIEESSKDLVFLNNQLQNELRIRNQVEKKLRESEKLFKSLTDNAPDMIMRYDKDFRLLYVNPAVERYSGIPSGLLCGKTNEEIGMPDHIARRCNEMFQKAHETKRIQEQELELIEEDRRRIFNLRIVPELSVDDNVESFISFSRDISESRQSEEALKESEEKFRRLTESSNALICEIDTDGRFTYVNTNYFENLGYRREDLIGESACIICHPDMKDEFINQIIGQSNITVHPQRNEWLFKDKDGNWRWFNCYSNSTVTPKGERHVSLVSFDINEKKTVEEQLKKFVSDLKYLNATKDKFFRIIAHDLKNPFSILLGASEILVNNFENYDQSSIREFGKMINSAAKGGFALLENLLEWARAQTGTLNFVPKMIYLKEVIEESFLSTYIYAANKKIGMQSSIPDDMMAFADKNMLNTIIRNLLNNAIKFTHEGGAIFLEAEKSDNFITISVKDSGVGIEEEDLEKLFRIDVKHTTRGTAQETGTGLGLILCKEFVEKHGGKIWVNSIAGKGSTFAFTLPREQAEIK